MSGIVNRLREGVHEATRPKDHNVAATGSGVPEGTVGPHNTRVANAADPRVDSDLDGRGAPHHNHHHHHHGGPGQVSSGNDNFGAAGNTRNTTVGSTNAGPHDSNMANKLDPRVDSDLDGSRNAGLNRTTNPSGNTFSATGTATGSTNAGPHDSNMANKLDPRVDSDLDGSRNAGMNQTTNMSGRPVGAGAGMGSTNAGPHNSNIANKLDPRVDSDLDGSRNVGMNQTTTASGRPMTNNATAGSTFTTGTTSGSTNAGPHKSNLMNKLDPRVDSDLDGSSNMGMNQTTRPHY